MTDLRALDAEFAEKVLGWEVSPGGELYREHDTSVHYYELPIFHRSLDAAWPGLEKLAGTKLISVDFIETADGWWVEVGWGSVSCRGKAEFIPTKTEAFLRACLEAVKAGGSA